MSNQDSTACRHDTVTLADIDRCQLTDGSVTIMPFKLCGDCKQAIPLTPKKIPLLTTGTLARIRTYLTEKRGCEVSF